MEYDCVILIFQARHQCTPSPSGFTADGSVTVSSCERNDSGLGHAFVEFLQTAEQSSHARHVYIYPAWRERDKREK